MRLNILLVGEESAGIQTLRALSQSGHRVVAVMASPPKANNGATTLWNVAEKLGYPTWPAKSVKDPGLADRLRAEKIDLLLNVHSLFIIPGEVLAVPRIGSFNMHPGPLPRYAGLQTVSWAIYRGEASYGVTIHKMLPGIDTGPIAYQTIFDTEETDTGLTLSSKCARAGVALGLRLIETATENPDTIPLAPQDLTKREYFAKGVIPNGGRLYWSVRGQEIVNFVRACDYFPFNSPWGHPRAILQDQEIRLTRAKLSGLPCDARPGTVGEYVESGVQVASLDEWIVVSRLMVEGKHIDAADLLRPGDRLHDGN